MDSNEATAKLLNYSTDSDSPCSLWWLENDWGNPWWLEIIMGGNWERASFNYRENMLMVSVVCYFLTIIPPILLFNHTGMKATARWDVWGLRALVIFSTAQFQMLKKRNKWFDKGVFWVLACVLEFGTCSRSEADVLLIANLNGRHYLTFLECNCKSAMIWRIVHSTFSHRAMCKPLEVKWKV